MLRSTPLLIACLLAACAAPTAPVGEPAPAPGADVASTEASPSRFPTIVRSLPPPRIPSPAPSVAPRPSSATHGVTVTGTVFSDGGLELYNATVSLQSLEPTKPFSFRVKAPKEAWTLQGVPPGVMAKVTATALLHAPRTQMITFSDDPSGEPVKLDFSGPYGLPKL